MKFEKEIIYINDKLYHNKKDASPYWYIFSIEEQRNYGKRLFHIQGIDRFGNNIDLHMMKSEMYKKLEVLDINKKQIHYMLYDFIVAVFNER